MVTLATMATHLASRLPTQTDQEHLFGQLVQPGAKWGRPRQARAQQEEADHTVLKRPGRGRCQLIN
jgi:hypothetical protein